MKEKPSISLKFMNIIQWIVYKFTSGRFLMSIAAGIGLLMMEKAVIDILVAKSNLEGGITATEILAFASTIFVVIQSVFMSYFQMRRTDGYNNRITSHPDDEYRPETPEPLDEDLPDVIKNRPNSSDEKD
ncbi:MAG: hypothetical protein M0R32_06865 [Candidatus Cloacimonetes bacterium]|jgi:hypothetical protein|nr:hypothetical protein [Candidatus Cloacimonadota bacterium]